MIDYEALCGNRSARIFALAPGIAHADPCTAQLPRHAGEMFTGTVRYVGDGAVAMARRANCTARRGVAAAVASLYDRVVAVCQVGGRSVGNLLRAAGAPTGGN